MARAHGMPAGLREGMLASFEALAEGGVYQDQCADLAARLDGKPFKDVYNPQHAGVFAFARTGARIEELARQVAAGSLT
jgi:hypothetical protein